MEAFLTDLAVSRKVTAAMQNQALAGLLFLYREVLGIELSWLDNIERKRIKGTHTFPGLHFPLLHACLERES